jgi:hypothetical protein
MLPSIPGSAASHVDCLSTAHYYPQVPCGDVITAQENFNTAS